MNSTNLIDDFLNIDLSKYPDFNEIKKPSDRALWVLFVSKEELIKKMLTAEQIAQIIRDVLEISINSQSIYLSLNPLADKGLFHKHEIDDLKYYEIMKPGKDYILAFFKDEITNIQYFKPGQSFTSKRILSKRLLEDCQGDLKIVDPYIGIRTLDMLKETKQSVLFLTKLSNLRSHSRIQNITREIRDFCSEFPNFKFKDYPNTDLHDRYIISDNFMIISGYSFKDLGNKESFALFLERSGNSDIIDIIENEFITKWNNSSTI